MGLASGVRHSLHMRLRLTDFTDTGESCSSGVWLVCTWQDSAQTESLFSLGR